MNYAITSSGETISLEAAIIRREEIFYCYYCQKAVKLRKTPSNKYTFYHLSDKRKHTHDFSEHQALQQQLCTFFKCKGISAGSEIQLANTIRADILVANKGKLSVFEIQRTNIQQSAIAYRTAFYQQRMIMLYWVLLVPVHATSSIITQQSWQRTLFKIRAFVVMYDKCSDTFYLLRKSCMLSTKKLLIQVSKISVERLILVEDYWVKEREKESVTSEQQYQKLFKEALCTRYRNLRSYVPSVQPLAKCLYLHRIRLPINVPNIFCYIQDFIVCNTAIFVLELYIYCYCKIGGFTVQQVLRQCLSDNLCDAAYKGTLFHAIVSYLLWIKKDSRRSLY